MRTSPIAPVLLVAFLVSLLAQAEAAPATVNVSDPLGDAGPNEQPTPGFEWGDIVAAWFEDETDTQLTGKIEVASAGSAPTFGEVALRITVGERHFLAGWTMLVIPQTIYQGGFICHTDSDYVADIETCTGLAGASVSDNVYTIPLAREDIGATQPGAVITRISAYADFIVGFEPVPVDRTADGADYTFAAADVSSGPGGPDETGPADTGSDTQSSPQATAPAPIGEAPTQEAPLGFVALAAGLMAALLAVRRRRFAASL